jgi:hypothetical protein
MSIKSRNVTNFIKQTGVDKQLFVFVGSDTNNTTSDSSQTELDIWNNSNFALRVGQNSISAVVPNHKWVQKRSYTPWFATQKNIGNYYAYNDQNGYVYLCISDNVKNTITRNKNISNIRPTHIAGIQSYSDGYSWLPLYKITPSHERFITASWIPVVSFETFDSSDQQTQLQKTQSFCSNNTSQLGNCGIYAKQALSTDDNSGTIEYQKGDLFTTAENISCSDCYYLMANNDKFVSVFYTDTEEISTTTTIQDSYEEIGNLISQNQISSASPYYYLYNINENDDLDDGCVISSFIDLTSFTKEQLIVTEENPYLSITSNTGSGASIRLITSIYEDYYIVDGIQIMDRGSGYKDITLSLSNSILNGISGSSLVDKITTNLDKIDHIGIDPLSVLDAQHVMIDARIEKKSISDSGLGIPTYVNFFGLVENPIGICGSTEVISGSELNKKIDTIYRTTIKVGITSGGPALGVPDDEEYYNIDISGEQSLTNVAIFGASETSLELKNIPYNKSGSLVGTTISSATSTNTIDAVQEIPTFVQYTGNILSTTKYSSNLPVSDVDSVIIRINMVRGM